MNFSNLQVFLTNIYQKTFGSLKNNLSKAYFLKFFFERNNKVRVPFMKFNYIFHNLKWRNISISTINYNLTYLFASILGFILIIALYILISKGLLVDYAQKTRITASLYVHIAPIFQNIFYFITLLTVHLISSIMALIRPNFSLYEDFLQTSTPEDNRKSLSTDLTPNSRLNLNYLKSFTKSLALPTIPTNLFPKSLSLDFWKLSLPTVTGMPNPYLSDLEFYTSSLLSELTTLFSASGSYESSFSLARKSIMNPDLYFHNFNTSELLNTFRADRWLFKNSILGNNSIFNMNLISQSYRYYNVFFSSHEFLLKKYFFNNQLRNNNFLFSPTFQTSKPINYAFNLINFTTSYLNTALHPLNSLFSQTPYTKYNVSMSTSKNTQIILNKVDLHTGDNLNFLLKITSNSFKHANIPFYTPLYQTHFKSPNITFTK